MVLPQQYRAIVGLGNPGPRFDLTRHNIGFYIVDEIAAQRGASFRTDGPLEVATITTTSGASLYLIKPQTYMNDSGKIAPWLAKKGIKPGEVIVIHDELEKPFSSFSCRLGGSARGHNGLRSLMELLGGEFWRIRVGIGRPAEKAQVADYVLSRFTPAEQKELPRIAEQLLSRIVCSL